MKKRRIIAYVVMIAMVLSMIPAFVFQATQDVASASEVSIAPVDYPVVETEGQQVPRSTVGVLRWDAQISNLSGPNRGNERYFVAMTENYYMSYPQFWHRLPWYAVPSEQGWDIYNEWVRQGKPSTYTRYVNDGMSKIDALLYSSDIEKQRDPEMLMPGGSQWVMDQEIKFAVESGIDYWAILHYKNWEPDWSGCLNMSAQTKYYFTSENKMGLRWCTILDVLSHYSDEDEDWLIEMMLCESGDYFTVLDGRPLIYLLNNTGGNDQVGQAENALIAARIESLRNKARAAGLPELYIAPLAMTGGGDSQRLFFDVIGGEATSDYITGTHDWSTPGGTRGVKEASNFASYRDTIMRFDRDKRINAARWGDPRGIQTIPIVCVGFDNRPRDRMDMWAAGEPWWVDRFGPVPTGSALTAANSPIWDRFWHGFTTEDATREEIAESVFDAMKWNADNWTPDSPNTIFIYSWNEFTEGGLTVGPQFNPEDPSKPHREALDGIKDAIIKADKPENLANGVIPYRETVTFDSNAPDATGAIPGSLRINRGYTVGNPMPNNRAGFVFTGKMPVPPSRPGFEFAGWTTAPNGGEAFNVDTVINAGGVTAYAQWNAVDPVNAFVVRFIAGFAGSSADVIRTVEKGTALGSAIPGEGSLITKRPDYDFAGWFTAPGEGGTEVTADTIVNSGIIVYARWEEKKEEAPVDPPGSGGLPPGTPVANLVKNPSFEDVGEDSNAVNWTRTYISGPVQNWNVGVRNSEGWWNARTGERAFVYFRDNEWAIHDIVARVTQEIDNIPEGIYDLSAWFLMRYNSHADDNVYMYIEGHDASDPTARIVEKLGWEWGHYDYTEYSIKGVEIDSGKATIGFYIDPKHRDAGNNDGMVVIEDVSLTGITTGSGGGTGGGTPGEPVPNVVLNPGFEEPLYEENWAQHAPHWKFNHISGPNEWWNTGVRVADWWAARTGAQGLAFLGASDSVSSFTQDITNIPNGTFTLSAWAANRYTSVAAENIFMFIEGHNADNPTERVIVKFGPREPTWDSYIEFKIDDISITSGIATIGFHFDPNGISGVQLFIDDVSLTGVTVGGGDTGTPGMANPTVFFSNGNNIVDAVTIDKGNTVASSSFDMPENPVRMWFSFAGWYTHPTDGVLFNENTVVAKDIVVYQRWVPETRTGTNVPVPNRSFAQGTVSPTDSWVFNPSSWTIERTGTLLGTFDRSSPTTNLNPWEGRPPGSSGQDKVFIYTRNINFSNNDPAQRHTVNTYQTITGLEDGYYTLSAWVITAGGSGASTDIQELYAKGYTGGIGANASGEMKLSFNDVAPWQWTEIHLENIPVTNGQMTIGFYLNPDLGPNLLGGDSVRVSISRFTLTRYVDSTNLLMNGNFNQGTATKVTPTNADHNNPLGLALYTDDIHIIENPAGWDIDYSRANTNVNEARAHVMAGHFRGSPNYPDYNNFLFTYVRTHNSAPHEVTLSQTVDGLPDGLYTLTANGVFAGFGGEGRREIFIDSPGSARVSEALGTWWSPLSGTVTLTNVPVIGGKATVGVYINDTGFGPAAGDDSIGGSWRGDIEVAINDLVFTYAGPLTDSPSLPTDPPKATVSTTAFRVLGWSEPDANGVVGQSGNTVAQRLSRVGRHHEHYNNTTCGISRRFIVDITFDQDVIGLTEDDIIVTGAGAVLPGSLRGSGKTYTVIIDPKPTTGTVANNPRLGEPVSVSVKGGAVTNTLGIENLASNTMETRITKLKHFVVPSLDWIDPNMPEGELFNGRLHGRFLPPNAFMIRAPHGEPLSLHSTYNPEFIKPPAWNFEFDGWDIVTVEDGKYVRTPFDPANAPIVTSGMLIAARWNVISEDDISAVTFLSDFEFGPAPRVVEVATNGTIGNLRMPVDPVRPGHTFAGWFTEPNGAGRVFAENTRVTDDITVYANWIIRLPGTIDNLIRNGTFGHPGNPSSANWSLDVTNWQVMEANTSDHHSGNPLSNSHAVTFMVWNSEIAGTTTGTLTQELTEIPDGVYDLTFMVQYWTEPPVTWSVEIAGSKMSESGSGHNQYEMKTLKEIEITGGTATLTFNFEGKHDGSSAHMKVANVRLVRSDGEPILVPEKEASIFFVVDGFQTAARTVATGTSLGIHMPADPVKEGHTFLGWFTEQNGGGIEITATTPLTSEITVFANWESDYKPGDVLSAMASGILRNGLTFNQLRLIGSDLWLFLDELEEPILLARNVNNRNIQGVVDLGDGTFLRFDFKGNGSNVRVFEVFIP